MAMKATFSLFLGLLSAAASAAGNTEKQTITFQGKERVYYTFAPEKAVAAPEKPAALAPLLLLLHDSGRDGMAQIEQWQTLAEQEGVVLAAPDSLNSREWDTFADGPEFLHAIVAAMQEKCQIDGKRIYLFGDSNGGVFALYMGVMESQYFAAGGAHAGAMRENFHPGMGVIGRKLPLAIWVGTEDPHSLTMARNTQNELKKHGFDAQVFEMKGHDHDYYAVAKDLNPKIWSFLSASSLETDAKWQTYRFLIDEPKKLRVSSGVAEQLKIHDVQPVYPWDARVNHITGTVLLQATIDQQGNTANIVAVQGDPILIKSAIKAVSQWKYRPFVLNGKPVEVETTIKIQYHM
jgi:TonB family protein